MPIRTIERLTMHHLHSGLRVAACTIIGGLVGQGVVESLANPCLVKPEDACVGNIGVPGHGPIGSISGCTNGIDSSGKYLAAWWVCEQGLVAGSPGLKGPTSFKPRSCTYWTGTLAQGVCGSQIPANWELAPCQVFSPGGICCFVQGLKPMGTTSDKTHYIQDFAGQQTPCQ